METRDVRGLRTTKRTGDFGQLPKFAAGRRAFPETQYGSHKFLAESLSVSYKCLGCFIGGVSLVSRAHGACLQTLDFIQPPLPTKCTTRPGRRPPPACSEHVSTFERLIEQREAHSFAMVVDACSCTAGCARAEEISHTTRFNLRAFA